MEWLTVGNLLNAIGLLLVWGVKNELKHIDASIKGVKECAVEAKASAEKAHERINFMLENRIK